MKNIYTLILLLVSYLGYSQDTCIVSITPASIVELCPGDSVDVVANAIVTGNFTAFDFNNGALPPGWTSTGTTTFTQSCLPGVDGSNYFWAGSVSSSVTPSVTTSSFDASCGGFIFFDMVFAVQGEPSPCEGPDQSDEGVELQYSLDGGATWLPIVYYSPGGFELPSNPNVGGTVATFGQATPYTTWSSFNVAIPPAAYSTNTIFRWYQFPSSGSCCDNWGLDNISVIGNSCSGNSNAFYDWGNGIGSINSFTYTPTVDTFFVVDIYDSLDVYSCSSDTVFVNLKTASLTYDLADTVYSLCRIDTISVGVTNLANADAPFSYNWSTGDTLSTTNIHSNGNIQDTMIYTVDITDGCGFTYPDSVILIVDQLLRIDTAYTQPSNACSPSGSVAFSFVGDSTSSSTVPSFSFFGPNDSTLFITNGTAQQELSTGWYYFTVSDDYCFDYDSAYVDILNPPIANLAGDPLSGCGPLEITFTNSSENTNDYHWDFGDGTAYNVNDLSSQTHTFNADALVTLIAYSDPTCADTAYLNISIIQCGCTDPNAENYNFNAIQNDGSCTYAKPIVVAPNVLSTSSTVNNNVFYLTTENTVQVDLIIFNRWGNVVYEENIDVIATPNAGWDGRLQNGREAEEGTYFYRYTAKNVNGDEIEGHGFLQLVRD